MAYSFLNMLTFGDKKEKSPTQVYHESLKFCFN